MVTDSPFGEGKQESTNHREIFVLHDTSTAEIFDKTQNSITSQI